MGLRSIYPCPYPTLFERECINQVNYMNSTMNRVTRNLIVIRRLLIVGLLSERILRRVFNNKSLLKLVKSVGQLHAVVLIDVLFAYARLIRVAPLFEKLLLYLSNKLHIQLDLGSVEILPLQFGSVRVILLLKFFVLFVVISDYYGVFV